MMATGIVLTLACFIAGHAWMDRHGVPGWPRLGISTLFILGSFLTAGAP